MLFRTTSQAKFIAGIVDVNVTAFPYGDSAIFVSVNDTKQTSGVFVLAPQCADEARIQSGDKGNESWHGDDESTCF